MFDIDVVMDLANQVGARVSREYPGIDAEDVTQEALAGYFEDKVSSTDPDYIYTVLHRHGTAYAAKERYDYVLASSQYLYRPKEVKALLEEVYFQTSSHDVPTYKDDRVSAEIDSGTVYASILDIQEAWKRLTPTQAGILIDKYCDGIRVEYKSVDRAVDALTRAMNIHVNRASDHEGPGARKPLSNAQAQHATRAVFDGDYGNDALDELQSIRCRQSANPGTYFDWGQ